MAKKTPGKTVTLRVRVPPGQIPTGLIPVIIPPGPLSIGPGVTPSSPGKKTKRRRPKTRPKATIKAKVIATCLIIVGLLGASVPLLARTGPGRTITSIVTGHGQAAAAAPKPGEPIPGVSVEQCKQNPLPPGDIRILCHALKYDAYGYLYGGAHDGDSPGASQRFAEAFKLGKFKPGQDRILDCSSLVSVAIYDAFGHDEMRVVKRFPKSPNWKAIDMRDARPGDVMYKIGGGGENDHIVIVYSNPGDGKLVVFEAYGYGKGKVDYKDQIRISYDQKYSRFAKGGALRYKGPGSSG